MTAPVMMPNCPSDETLAAFIDGRLTGDERQQVLEHVSICSECRDAFQTAHEFAEESGHAGNVVPLRRSWLIPGATLAAAAAIATVVFLGPAGDGYRRERDLRELSAATAHWKERPIAARPSIDVAYKDHQVMRSGGEEAELGDHRLLSAAAKLGKRAEDRRTAANLHAAGVAFLLAGDYAKEAVQLLEEAQAAMSPPGPELLNDLAAAYYETNDPRARETIDRAWQLKKSPNIAWTRATILGSEQAWKDYLAIDSTSEWAAEARENLEFFAD